MVRKAQPSPGDLVFAKVKGFPAWPARVQGRQPNGKFAIFFYGTFETASLKNSEIWPYDAESKDKFCIPTVVKRKGYLEGLDQIEHTPEIAPILADVVLEAAAKPKTSPAPIVLKKPVKMLDGTPIKPPGSSGSSPPASGKRGKKEATEDGEEGAAKRSHLEDAPEVSSPSTVSRSGRVIKPKKNIYDEATVASDQGEESKVADKIIEEPRKVWVKLVASGDLVEINLDRDKPARWESGHQKLQWELATARNALKFKQQVAGGAFIPEEVRKKLVEKTALAPEEEEVLRRAATLTKRRKKVAWLKTEQEMVDIDIGIRRSLSASNPQIPRCVTHLTALLSLPLQPLMLVKQPNTVDTLRRLRKYAGPSDLSGYSATERQEIARGVKQVKERSAAVLARLASLFPGFTASSGTFPDYLEEQVAKHLEATKGWPEDKVLGMTGEAGAG